MGCDDKVQHNMSSKNYDQRRLVGRRAYLQCVLFVQHIIDKGINDFSSVGTQAYFDALLRSKKPVQPGLQAQQYRKMLAMEKDEEDPEACAALALADEEGAPRRRCPALPAPSSRAPEPIADMAAETECGSMLGGDDSHPSGGDDEGDGSGYGPVGGGEGGDAGLSGAQMPYPATIAGVHVSFVPGRISATHTYSDRLSVKCCNVDHPRCSKSRSMAMLQERLGPRAAEAFLGAWLSRADAMQAAAHTRYTPSFADMVAWLAANP